MRRNHLLSLGLVAASLTFAGCAGRVHTDRARAALSANRPIEARAEFRRAVEDNPSLHDNPEFSADFRRARRDAAVAEGRAALDRGEHYAAIDRFEAALQEQPGYEPAADGLEIAQRRATADLLDEARKAADQNQLAVAQMHVEDALDLQPGDPTARQMMQQLGSAASTDTQPPLYRQAWEAREAGDWPQAIARLDRLVQEQPNYLPGRAARADFQRDAADAQLEAGRAALADGDLNRARQQFRQALRFVPDHPGVRPALAEVDLRRGEIAQDNGRLGEAWLAFRSAQKRLVGLPEAREAGYRLDQLMPRLLEDHRPTVHVVADPDAQDQAADELAQRVRQQLAADADSPLILTDDGQPLAIRIDRLDTPQATVTTSTRRHSYPVRYEVPNPYFSSYGYGFHRGYYHSRSHGYYNSGPVGSVSFSRTFGGSHRSHGLTNVGVGVAFGNYDRRDHHHHRRYSRYDYPDRRYYGSSFYAYQPLYVTRTRTESFPYAIQTHTRTGELSASFQLGDQDGPARRSVNVQRTDSDDVVLEPRPELGLAEDPLTLVDDETLRQQLLDAAARKISTGLAESVVQDKVAQLEARADQATNPDEALQLRVAAALLLKPVSPIEADQKLNRLTASIQDADQ